VYTAYTTVYGNTAVTKGNLRLLPKPVFHVVGAAPCRRRRDAATGAGHHPSLFPSLYLTWVGICKWEEDRKEGDGGDRHGHRSAALLLAIAGEGANHERDDPPPPLEDARGAGVGKKMWQRFQSGSPAAVLFHHETPASRCMKDSLDRRPGATGISRARFGAGWRRGWATLMARSLAARPRAQADEGVVVRHFFIMGRFSSGPVAQPETVTPVKLCSLIFKSTFLMN
jgi:hypothetical protein